MDKNSLKELMVKVGHAAWLKGLTAGWGGNISIRNEDDTILITPHGKSLGLLEIRDILTLDPQGELVEGEGRPSMETEMHLALYRGTELRALIHLHPPCLNSLAAKDIPLDLETFETHLTLGTTPPILEQATPVVTDMVPLLEAFATGNIVCLKNHGTVAGGEDLPEALALTDVAEEAARMTINGRILTDIRPSAAPDERRGLTGKLPVFSKEHMARIQKLVNNDREAQRLGQETDLTVKYAIKQTEDGRVFNMHFKKGRIINITDDEDADFVNVGKKEIWIHVFNGRLDPFAATSQKKLRLVKGHIGDLSKWYAPFYRIFALWKDAPVKELNDE